MVDSNFQELLRRIPENTSHDTMKFSGAGGGYFRKLSNAFTGMDSLINPFFRRIYLRLVLTYRKIVFL